MSAVNDTQTSDRLDVSVEVPGPWLKSKRDGLRNREMFALVESALEGYNCRYFPISLGTAFEQKSAPAGGFSLSYHSCGDARHVWRLKETPVPHFYSFDRLGFSGWSEVAQLPERYRPVIEAIPEFRSLQFIRRLAKWLKEGNLSKYEQPSGRFGVQEPFVFFPLQVRSDVVARFCRVDPIRALHRAAHYARRTKTLLVVKRHPYCHSPTIAAALAFESSTNPYVKLTNASVQQILPACSAVLVANSGVGFEALIHEKPVFSFAYSEYEAYASGIFELDDIASVFDFQRWGSANTALGARFVYFFLNQMCFDARDQASLQKRIAVSEHCARRDIWCERSIFDLNEQVHATNAL